MGESKFDYSNVKPQSVSFKQIEDTFAKAVRSNASAVLLEESDPEGSFTLAYESMLKATLALMYSHGYRPRVQMGHHKTLVNYARNTLGPELSSLTSTYDKMRDKRNKIMYDTQIISMTEARKALELSAKYLGILSSLMESENPQLKLFKL